MTPSGSDIATRLQRQVETWRQKLLDIGNRNPLVNCSFNLSRGVLEIVHPDCETIWRALAAESEAGYHSLQFPWRRELVPPPKQPKQNIANADPAQFDDVKEKEWRPTLEECLASRRLHDNNLLTVIDDKALDRRLRTLHAQSRLSLSEQGVNCLYIAFGFLKWFESSDSDKELWSPLMLVPVTLSRATSDAPWELTEAEDDVVDNLCLRQRLFHDFQFEIPALPDLIQLEERGARAEFLAAVRTIIAKNDRWEVEDRCTLGRFAFPKIAMWKDLGDHCDSVMSHPLCRSIGGDAKVPTHAVIGDFETVPTCSQLDDAIAPGEVKAILDCDSSQLEAIVAARRGISFVLDGPPGTGKSQTISNIIADALAEGRRVLFVSEKVAALEVVKRRLDDCGLGDFCLECHSSKANRKGIVEELQRCLELSAEVYDDTRPKLRELEQTREALNKYVRAIHTPLAPFGLTPYELYGHVTRLGRLGLSTKCRCELPDPAAIDHETFSAWLEQLTFAKEVENVIDNYSDHPWRGCRMTSRSLSLLDDVKHYFGLLVAALKRIVKLTDPLVSEGLLGEHLTPENLVQFRSLLRDALDAPDVPKSWFSQPDRIAQAVLKKRAADGVIDECRAKLSDYVDDVAVRFSDDLSELRDPDAYSWLSQFIEPLPSSLREQRDRLTYVAKQLGELAGCAAKLEAANTELWAALGGQVNVNLRIGSVPQFVRMARVIANAIPMRPGWFEPQNWSKLRQLSEAAIAKLTAAEQAFSQLGDRVSRSRLERLHGKLPDVESIREAWSVVQCLVPEGRQQDLDTLAKVAQEAMRLLSVVVTAADSLASSLRLKDFQQLTLREVASLCDSLGDVVAVGVYHGSWRDVQVRVQVRDVCHEAIDDLNESHILRETLQARMSHRAFQPAAATLSERATRYRSWWMRLFGGFSTFRDQAADVYLGNLRDTAALLADFSQLRAFHRRRCNAWRHASEMRTVLPEGHVGDDVASWSRVRDAVCAFDALLRAVPGLARVISPETVRLDSTEIESSIRPLSEAVTRLDSVVASTLLHTICNSTGMRDLGVRLTSIYTSALACSKVWDQMLECYQVPPVTLVDLLSDVVVLKDYVRARNDVSTMFQHDEGLMSAHAEPFDRTGWERTRAGVEAAEVLSGMVRNAASLRDATCRESGIDAEAVYVATETVDATFRATEGAWRTTQTLIRISPPGKSAIEIPKESVSVLRSLASEASDQFRRRADRLSQIVQLLKNEANPPVEKVVEDFNAIMALRAAIRQRDGSIAALGDANAESPDGMEDNGHVAATWLLAYGQERSISPVVRAAASDRTQRARLVRIFTETNKILDREWPTAWKFLEATLDIHHKVSRGWCVFNAPLSELAEFLDTLRGETTELDAWLRFRNWQSAMQHLGLGEVVEELLQGRYTASEAAEAVTARVYRKMFDWFAEQHSILGEFHLESHERIRERFRQLDEWEIKAAATQIRQSQLGRDDRPRSGWNAPGTSELGVLRRETVKKRRHKALRKLFAEIPGVLQRLKPCIMMSPLSVSTFLESDEIRFDLVIFDEASQVFPWDAIGAIYRGAQVIVAGDEKQLPPTNLFTRSDLESDEEEEDIGDFESILSLCKSINMPSIRLRWHYRSRREPLIAFSNRCFYGGELVTFPSVRDASRGAVRLELVQGGRWIDRKNLLEAERIADLVIEHLRTRPETSLGVIAFSSSQQQAIEDAIYDRRRVEREIDALFDIGLTEPLFIKNLENVQGDERDVILLSVGYAFNEAGKFLKNFGPLTKAGGERRLNVAVTRAREEVVLVSSVRAADMDLSGSTSDGSHLLKTYLEYAERGIDALARATDLRNGDCESIFESEVSEALVRRGLSPIPQVGCGGFRIDLALRHPQRPGEFCLGIECDGATYHSSHTARDRDRIRQDVLKELGWTIVRVWSTDWVRDPERQIARILSAYESVTSTNSGQQIVEASPSDEEDLQPRYVQLKERAGRTYRKIEDVPDGQIREAARVVFMRNGAVALEDLMTGMARELGFARTGKKIRQRFEGILSKELKSGEFRMVGDRITVPHTP